MKVCYFSHHLVDKATGAAQVSLANLDVLKNTDGIKEINEVNLSDLTCSSALIRKCIIFMRSLFGYSSCLGYIATNRILNSTLLRESQVIWCDGSLYGPLIKKITRKYPEKKIVTFFHNVESDFYQSIYPKNKPIYSLFINSSRKNEHISTSLSDTLVTLTSKDALRVQELYGKKVEFTIPVLFSENISLSDIEHRVQRYGFNCLFVGSDFPPNIEAVEFLCKEVMPYVNDDVSLIIAGKGMDKYRDRFEKDNVIVKGFVESLSSLYQESDLILSPIFSGAGMKVKIAEAFKFGKPVLGTEFSFQGYDLGKDFIYIAESKNDYVNFLNKLKDDFKYEPVDILSYYNENLTVSSQIKKMNSIIFD
ncbi:glycosyltransferase [Vibrio owensii]|uniref:glycosyltransferase n=1 Tax=Vibrio owensii TaxID=696485 RepID=UPI003749CBBD